MKKFLKNFLALSFGILIALLVLEGFLRIYDPIPQRIKGGKIVLPVNRKYLIKNDKIAGVDPLITHTKNSLGFRGEEMPADFEKYLSLITIGGSTTECYYLSDNKTWPYLLEENLKGNFQNVWVNNAGFDGHSTFGHQILLDDYISKIKPEFVLFLTGFNDMGRNDLNYGFDNRLLKNSYVSALDFLSKKSALINLVLNIARSIKARQLGVSHQSLDFGKLDTLTLSDTQIKDGLDEQKKYLDGYEARLNKLVITAKDDGIKPVLMTQPTVWGTAKDPSTGADLESAKVDEKRNGKLFWQELELYNDRVRKVGKDTGTPVIDLARELPKDSAYFYDTGHFTNAGAAKVAGIVGTELTKYFKTLNIK